ncbi:MAG: T9SS type A sorting domain-containing protein [bacterium]|nr:T9SS type A sorting domain-containing protein [bacterium]
MKKLLFTIFLGATTLGNAQTADLYLIGSLGGEFSNASIDVNFSAGEAVIQTMSDANVIVTQGFHQPTSELNSIFEISKADELKLYPNPVQSELNIEYNSNGGGEATVQIFDAFGRLVLSDQINVGNNSEVTLKVDAYSFEPGQYQVVILSDTGETARSKFIKL